MTTPIIVERHPRDELLRVDRLPHIWCPGCGLGKVLSAYAKAVKESDIEEKKHVVVSGIGCTGRSAGYLNIDSYHSLHGRAIPFATGLKLANKKLEVTVISGDGDLSTIGGNHIIHAARRNINLNIVLVNNFTYGMTGGQASATTPIGAKTTTTTRGNYDVPFNLPFLMKAAGATHIARWTALHHVQMQESIAKAFTHDGFSFIEVVSPCPKGFGKKNKFRDAIDALKYFENMAELDQTIELETANLDMDPKSEVAIGEFFYEERDAYFETKDRFYHYLGEKSK
ncbi:MAG: thiamine pyrophosphate-dependent enzyme [Candidatus Kariarchaeaceae archaeon]|jgi:2-oxoglutarate ferredoxin oxidoreductase subunit beta